MRGKWAAGIPPRNFAWVIKERLAISERPGGYARNHRKVRRQEEIIWLREQGFNRIVSVLASPHNLHAYEEAAFPYSHFPIGPHDDVRELLPNLYESMRTWMAAGERLLVHQEELGDRLVGIMGGFLLWTKMLTSTTQAIVIVERIAGRQLGPPGREIVNLVPDLMGSAR